ncbi:MAG: NADH:flavin oxidoreductase/NADH oxidase family protein [Xanthomonadales bacterium]|nr:NADH:flavin oxidoreductase/NADH oxidase family protein [Xanthomonadales bacterium]
MTEASPLASPLELPCGVTLPNRIAKAAMTEGIADDRNRATDGHVTLYRRWAEGGAGMLLTGNVQVDRRYLERPGNVVVDGPQDDEQLRRLEAWAGVVRELGSTLWMQISHAGRQSPKIVATEPVAPSAIALGLPGGQFGKPRALEGAEIEEIIERFAHAASVARETGFGGVQVHAAHGYLISEFLNPRVNRRDDAWGGSLENRARLLLRIVDAVRAAVGAQFPVAVKLNSSDFQKGGFSFDECLQVVNWLNATGIDLLEISGGSYEQPRMMDLKGLEKPVEDRRRESTRKREAYFLEYAERVAEVATMPLMVTGGFRSRAVMEEAIAGGKIGLIGIGRPLCVDPAGPRELLEGTTERLPAWEKELALGPGFLGPNSRFDLVKALNGFGSMAFFYENLIRVSHGRETDPRMRLLPALVRHQFKENRKAKALVR